jgi:hypothetical protein
LCAIRTGEQYAYSLSAVFEPRNLGGGALERPTSGQQEVGLRHGMPDSAGGRTIVGPAGLGVWPPPRTLAFSAPGGGGKMPAFATGLPPRVVGWSALNFVTFVQAL